MNKEKTVDVLNTLIVINNDRIEGYETASKETGEESLKALFADFQQTSRHCKAELMREVDSLGGTPDEGTRVTGKFFRVWMDVKVALSGNDRKAILDSCEYGEKVAAETYTDALKDNEEDITTQQATMLNAQQMLLKADFLKIEKLREMLLAKN
jgi:uncharacterized protein (TIGR02284 family)